MNKKELINAVAERTNISKKEVGEVLNATAQTMIETLKKDEKIQIIGCGTIELKKRAARVGRNPQTKEEIMIPASCVPTFKAGKALKETFNQ